MSRFVEVICIDNYRSIFINIDSITKICHNSRYGEEYYTIDFCDGISFNISLPEYRDKLKIFVEGE